MAAPTSLAAMFTVNSAVDATDGVCDVLDCTLREAIDAANTTEGPDTIVFGIGVGGPATIRPFSPLPQITDQVLIDGTTQPGYSGSPLIELDGIFLGPGAAGLSVAASSTGIKGLAVNRFPGNGIELVGGGFNNVVTSNYVGVGLDGVTARGNGNGVASSSSSNTIGGTAASLRNVISGNTQYGIELTGGGANTVEGNFVGTDASGNVAVPNFRGVGVNSDENTIGSAAGVPNVVSGNSDAGVFVTGSDNDVRNNYIGTDANATTAVPNGFGGVYVLGGATSASSNTFTANVISGNASFGALISSSVPNSAANNDFDSNLIGTDSTGQKRLGNTGPGIAIGKDSGIGQNLIGGSPSSSNTIAFNSKGISLGSNTARNEFTANSIHDNTFIGIDLNDDGVTPNDPGDGDTGAERARELPRALECRQECGRHRHRERHVRRLAPELLVPARLLRDSGLRRKRQRPGWNLARQSVVAVRRLGPFLLQHGQPPHRHRRAGSVITATATDTFGDTSEFSACKAVPSATTTTFTVDTTDGTTDGTCGDGNDCSLGDAISAANVSPGTDRIEFNLPGPSLVITPTPSLPAITDGVVIDGTTQPGFSASSRVQVDGAAATGDGLTVGSGVDGSTIRGLSITGFPGAGISLSGPPSVVEGNYIGVKPDGTGPGGNGSGGTFHGGIVVGSQGNRIGGTTAATRNVISANNPSGIVISEGAGNVILGNRIGTNVDGDHAVPNTGNGIYFPDPLGVPTIGGGAPGEGNLISGNAGSGIWIDAGDGAVIQGNTIGLAVDRSTAMPNGADGIHAEFAGGVIGGVGPSEWNVVSGNGGAGIALVNVSSTPTRVQGNLVGLKASGDGLVPNGAGQVVVSGSDSIDIGGATAAARNVISGGGTSDGVLLDSLTHDVRVEGNYIGTDSTGEVGLGNGSGVVVAGGSHDNTIGGSVPGARNVISASSNVGVSFANAGAGNRVLGNSIGTDKDEATVLANKVGVELFATSGTTVGSAVPPIGNVIAGSTVSGVVLHGGSNSNTFAGNFVGTDRTDTADFGNADGLRFDNDGGNDNVIGPTNVFAHSVDRGIEMNTGTGNRISASTFHDNGNDAIFLNEAANHNQAAPTVDSAVNDVGTVHVDGSLASTLNSTFSVEVFSTPTCTGKPQGRTYLGSTPVTTDEIGHGSFSFSSNVPSEGDAITATATDTTTHDTSGFSACTTVVGPTLVVTTADDHDDGVCDSDCTLREALNVSNVAEGRINISFAIDASGTQTIALASGLPNITNPVVIDGTTQIDHQLAKGFAPPAAGDPAIEISGINEVAADGLVLASGSGGSTLRGLGIQNFTLGTFEGTGAAGVRVSSSGNTLEDLYVGTSSTGLLARPNDNGIIVTGDANTIGPGNLVSGNSELRDLHRRNGHGCGRQRRHRQSRRHRPHRQRAARGRHRDRGVRRAEDDHRRADGSPTGTWPW